MTPMTTTVDSADKDSDSGWAPGQRVITARDHAAWVAWRALSKRDGQRARRAAYHRIDYYPADDVAALIYNMASRGVGGDLSSIINRIVTKWAALRDALPPE